MKCSLSTFLSIVALFSLVGCHTLPHYTPPSESAALCDSPSACASLCRSTLSAKPPLASFRALANVQFTYDGDRASFRYVVIAKGSDRFRMDLLPEEGAFTIGMVVINGATTTIIDAQNRTFSRGTDERELLKDFLKLEGVDRSVVVGLLSGNLPPSVCERCQLSQGGNDVIVLRDLAANIVWHLTPTGEAIGVVGLDDDGDRKVFEAHTQLGALLTPSTVSMQLYDPVNADLDLRLEKVTQNGQVSDALFSVQIPAGYTKVGG